MAITKLSDLEILVPLYLQSVSSIYKVDNLPHSNKLIFLTGQNPVSLENLLRLISHCSYLIMYLSASTSV